MAKYHVGVDVGKNHHYISIRDNGVGFDTEARTEGAFGLIGMRERVRLLGGTLVVWSGKGKGILVEVTLPTPEERQNLRL